jgi:hypothetical protein
VGLSSVPRTSITLTSEFSHADEKTISDNSKRNGNQEIDPLTTIDFEEEEVYVHSRSVLQDEQNNDRGSDEESQKFPRDVSVLDSVFGRFK